MKCLSLKQFNPCSILIKRTPHVCQEKLRVIETDITYHPSL